MASTAHTGSSLECNYLHSHTSPIPHVFPNKQAELAHINEQIHSLDSHIAQLNSLRRALHDRSHQLRNSLSPTSIHSLPVEILSHIFQQATEREVYYYPKFQGYLEFLRQSFVLSSVSTYFRHAALCTPELWRRIPLKMSVGREMGQLVSLLRHCMTFAHKIVDVSVEDRFDDEQQTHSAIETLFTYDVTQRIRSLELSSPRGLDVWQPTLKGSSFPILDNLGICGPDLYFNLGTLNTVTRLEIRNECPDCRIIMPPSVRYLFLNNAAPDEFASMLSHCPDLEECLAYDSECYIEDQAAQFDRPLTLTHLKRLTLGFTTAIMSPSLVENLRLPSLEYLQFKRWDAEEFDGFLLFCRNVSATLMTLKLELPMFVYEDHLYQLYRLSFPNLRKLGLTFTNLETMQGAIYDLANRAEECSMAQLHYLPSLAALTLRYDGYEDGQINFRCILDLLEKWRVGETSYFHLKIKEPRMGDRLGLLMHLKSIMGNRQIGITWNGRKVH